MANVGKLVVELSASTAKFQRDLQEATSVARQNARRIDSILGGIGRTLGTGLSIAAFAGFTKSAIDAADQLNDLAKKTGSTVEVLAGLRLAADQSGTSLESVAVGLKNLSREMTTSPDQMKALGIETKNSVEAMIGLADIFKSMPDDATKTTLALQLFGKSGSDMVPLLNEGSESLRKMIERGTDMAKVSTRLAEEADRFNDSLVELKTLAFGAGTSMAEILVPGLNDATRAMIRAAEEGRPLLAMLTGIAAAGKIPFDLMLPTAGKAAELRDINGQIAELEKQAKPLRDATKSGKTKDPLGIFDIKLNDKSLSFAGNKLATLERQIQGLRDRAKKLLEPQTPDVARPAAHPALEAASCIAAGGSFKDGKCVMPGRSGGSSRGGRSSRAAPKPEAPEDVFGNQSFIANKEDAEFIRQQFSDVNDLQSEIQNSTSRANEEFERQVERIRDLANPMRPYRRELEEIHALYDKGAISIDEWAAATESVREKMGSAFGNVKKDGEDAFDGIADAIGMAQSAFKQFVQTGKIDFREMLRSWAAEAANKGFEKLLPSLLGIFTGGPARAPVVDLSFPAGRAHGGPVSAGTPYIIGENGPELFTPHGSGYVTPNHKLPSGGGVAITYNIDARGADAGVLPRLQALMEQNNKKLKSEILDSKRRGGAFS